MSDSFIGDMFGGRGRGPGSSSGAGGGQPWPMNTLWEAFEQLKGQFDQKTGGSRMARGDVRAAVLALLAEAPMHGYQIIREIDERSGGSWKPSPGSVYPTLQLLTDEGLITATESDGRKTYSLTAEGRAVVDGDAGKAAPWQTGGAKEAPRGGALAKAGVELAQAAAQVGRSGKPAQVAEAVEVLEEARRRLYSILAQD